MSALTVRLPYFCHKYYLKWYLLLKLTIRYNNICPNMVAYFDSYHQKNDNKPLNGTNLLPLPSKSNISGWYGTHQAHIKLICTILYHQTHMFQRFVWLHWFFCTIQNRWMEFKMVHLKNRYHTKTKNTIFEGTSQIALPCQIQSLALWW